MENINEKERKGKTKFDTKRIKKNEICLEERRKFWRKEEILNQGESICENRNYWRKNEVLTKEGNHEER